MAGIRPDQQARPSRDAVQRNRDDLMPAAWHLQSGAVRSVLCRISNARKSRLSFFKHLTPSRIFKLFLVRIMRCLKAVMR